MNRAKQRRATNEQDAVLVARAHRGVSDPGYEPGPYAPNEGQVEAFVAWYTGRLRASRQPAPTMAE